LSSLYVYLTYKFIRRIVQTTENIKIKTVTKQHIEKFFFGRGGDDDTACGPKCKSLIHINGHDKTSDTAEYNLYKSRTK